MGDISFLPEELRKKEDRLASSRPADRQAEGGNDLRFSMPTEQEEDIEIIEVDEGELDQVLAGEPPLARLAFKVRDALEGLFEKLRQPKGAEPPPKLPPQFFAPPAAKPGPQPSAPAAVAPMAPGAAVLPAGATAQGAAGKRLIDDAKAPPAVAGKPVAGAKPLVAGRALPGAGGQPRRVRVIKRVRKPVSVSFVSNEALLLSRVDVPKRRFTFLATLTVFSLLFAASYVYLSSARRTTLDNLALVQGQITELRRKAGADQQALRTYKDLEPQLKALGVLLDAHMSPTSLLENVERVTVPQVSYDALAFGAGEGKLRLNVTAADYEVAARQVLAFKQAPFVRKAEVASYSATYPESSDDVRPVSVKFQVDVTLAPEALRPPTSTAATTTAYAP